MINRKNSSENALIKKKSTIIGNKRVSPHYLQHKPHNRINKVDTDRNVQNINQLQK